MDWYVAVTKANAEARACVALTGAGVNFFLPTMRIFTFDSRRHVTKTIVKPLFTRYVFVEGPCFHTLHGIDEIIAMIGVAGVPLPVREADVMAWKADCAAGRFDKNPINPKQLKPGMKVRMQAGALSGYYGMVVDPAGRKTVKVLAELFGTNVHVSVPVDSLEMVA
jgi:transcription antitermination factor NusG